ncbi:MAG: M23 family metallopeptidase [Deltaproteobacteria bacterium]|nr:M23 family metallopeptidase [Deltaproteobacteria bacterium]
MSHSALLSVPIVVALVLFSLPARAACEYANCHSTGAVQKPSGFAISLPFAEGEQVELASGYGPNAGSGLHCRAQDSVCANDYYALDFVLPNHSNYGTGQPVLAIAGGTVLDAGWGTEGWKAYGRRVYIEHSYDGHKYVSMYAHLDSIGVSTGQQVSQGDVLGTLGSSCNNANSCSNFWMPHLHFAIHRDSNFGGSGSGGSYGGRATIPEPMDGYTGLQQGQVLTSKNGATPPPPECECDDPQATQTQPCGTAGTQIRSCDGCDWSEWSECAEPPSGGGGAGGDGVGGSAGASVGEGAGGGGTPSSPTAPSQGSDSIGGNGLEGMVCSTRGGVAPFNRLAVVVLAAFGLALGLRSRRRPV